MNHAHPLIHLLNIADNNITVGELKAAANAMFPSPEAWPKEPGGMLAATSAKPPKPLTNVKVDVSYKDKDVTPTKPAKVQRKPRAEKAPGTEVVTLLERVVTLFGNAGYSTEGLRAEAIRQATGYPAGVIGRALRFGVNSGKLRREGEKRATTYYLR